jgi:hypothetical protein
LSLPDFEIEPPQVYVLRDLEDLRERWLDARAARYEPDTNELFVNATYPSIPRLRDHLLSALAETQRGEAKLVEFANTLAEEAAIERLAYTVLRLNARARSKAWTPGNRDRALSGEALSVVADDLEMWEAQMRERLISAATAGGDTPSTTVAEEEGRLAAI